jgi:Beta propeller domain
MMGLPHQPPSSAGRVQAEGRPRGHGEGAPQSGALVLRIDDSGITETGLITQPETANTTGYPRYSPIERSLIIGQTLWTISTAGARASDLTTLRQQRWVPFDGPGSSATH